MSDAVTKAADAAADALHQHGPTVDAVQTPRWEDCPKADTHRGAGRDVAAAVLDAVDYDTLERVADAARELHDALRHRARGLAADVHGRDRELAAALSDLEETA